MQQLQSRLLRLVFVCTVVSVCVLSTPLNSDAASYFVGKNGNDGNTCATVQSRTTPKLTINGVFPCLQAGDVVVILPGEYRESLLSPPGGTSWTQAVTYRADVSLTVILKPDPGVDNAIRFASAASQFVIIDGFDVDAVNVDFDAIKITSGVGQSNFIRIINCVVRNAPLNGIFVDGTGNEFIATEIRDNGITIFTTVSTFPIQTIWLSPV
jgi:hypothetical protein